MNTNSVAPCPLCLAPGSRAFAQSRGRRLKRDYLLCPRCALVWVPESQRMSAEAEKARYDHHQNDANDEGYRQHLKRMSVPLIAILAPGATGLDFGCGPCPLLQTLLVDAGFPTAVHDPFYAPNEAALLERYHFITATEVVEHLSEPGAQLDRLWSLLHPAGILALMTRLRSPKRKFEDWLYKNDPTLIAFFSRKTIDYLGARWKIEPEFVDVDVVFFRKDRGSC